MSLFKSGFSRLPKYKKFNYQPRYYDPEEEERLEKKGEIKLERGSFYKKHNHRLVGAFTDRNIALRDRVSKRNQLFRMVLLSAMLGLITLYFIGKLSGLATFGALFVLILIFIAKANKI